MTQGRFVWVTHQVGVTRWLKTEVAARAPGLRFAFSRPGLTTFKVEDAEATAAVRVPTSFARAWGLSLGRAESAAQVLELLQGQLAPPRSRTRSRVRCAARSACTASASPMTRCRSARRGSVGGPICRPARPGRAPRRSR